MPISRLWSIPLFTLALIASAQRPRLQFQDASVEVYATAPGEFMMRMNGLTPPVPKATGNRFTAKTHLSDLISEAYGIFDYAISGLPAWAQSPNGAVFRIDAKIEGADAPAPDQLRQMLQSLLADRFQLQFHKEMRESPIYALMLGKDGSKMRQMAPDERIPAYLSGQPAMSTSMGTYSSLFLLLTAYADRPVIDETGLSGKFEYADLNLGAFPVRKKEDPLAAQDALRAAVEEKLGLELEPRETKMEIFVVDHVEQPSPN